MVKTSTGANDIMKAILIALIILVCMVSVASAAAPGVPTLLYPVNESTIQDSDTKLIVNVLDADTGNLNVTFYNASNGSLIGYCTVNTSGDAGCVWSGLEYGNTYIWNVSVSDGVDSTSSLNFTFTLNAATPSALQDEQYLNPPDGSIGWVDVTNTSQLLEMSVKPFVVGAGMGSWFYAIMIYSFVGLIYMKSQRAFLPSAVLLLCGITMSTIMPGEITFISLTMVCLGFISIIYQVAKRKL